MPLKYSKIDDIIGLAELIKIFLRGENYGITDSTSALLCQR
jgi:hypothetical protein